MEFWELPSQLSAVPQSASIGNEPIVKMNREQSAASAHLRYLAQWLEHVAF
jgi:hypothetical protein